MRFGIWHDFRNPPQWAIPYDRLYRENLEQIVLGRTARVRVGLGLRAPRRPTTATCPSVFPLLAAIAVRTTRSGSAPPILLGPFQHPIRFAEDVAVVDQLSGGRLEVGLGLGYREREFERARRPRSPSAHGGPRSSSSVARRGWATGRVTPAAVSSSRSRRSGSEAPRRRRRAAPPGSDARSCPTPTSRPRWSTSTARSAGRGVAINPSIYVGDLGRGRRPHFLYQYNRYREWGGGRRSASAEELPRDRYLIGVARAGRRGSRQRWSSGRARSDCSSGPARPGSPIELANRRSSVLRRR